ncbi:hypothetical protein [Cellulomonas sp. URHE0023]|uniref:hypothetical protein n=1 Tax=Cellulomonas sp. URHE0023 TaxID=1380354 RepID=UPI0004816792|nr:hypothetical protein [Cellulomonas sp. URHE0023]
MTVPARSSGSGPDQAPDSAIDLDDAAEAAVDVQIALVEPPSPAEILESAVATWRAALVEAAGGSTLVDVELLGEAALDLSAAHPSGISQLFAGRETRLSNLVREGAALSTARRRARAVSARAAVYAQRYGILPTSLAIGVATWTERTTPDVATDDVAALATITRQREQSGIEQPEAAPRTVRAPVLLRPVSLKARGSGESDYELALEPSLEVNPVLARALRSRGALLDPAAVARGTFTSNGFDPRGALQRLASLGEAVLDDFTLTERVVVGTFVHPGQILVDDLDNLSGTLERHEVVAALAGIDGDLRRPLPAPVPGDRDPVLERGVGDLDPAQQHVLDVVATGTHLFVDTPAGADVTGTLAALVADAAASGRTVLYVPGHRRAATALASRLTSLGLGDLLLDVAPDAGWRSAISRRLLGAMTLEAPAVDAHGVIALRSSLVAERERLRAYVDALHVERPPWGVSAYDALQQLARLTSTRPTPKTTVRLTADVARVLDAQRRVELTADLVRAGELGAFQVRPTDTPWYGADLRTRADADNAVRRLERLLDGTLPALVERTAQVAAETGLVQATTVNAWAEQLGMLDGVRAALDVFQPIVFERTAADLVAATASKQWREQHDVPMGYWVRRRLRKQSKDMLRPGRPIADLHAALLEVQAQREVWQAHCPSGGWPRLPDGLELIEEEFAAVRADLDALDEVLAGTPLGARLSTLPFAALQERLTRLRADVSALETLPDRTGLLHRLRNAGLAPLVEDLASRRVDPALAPAELDLAWWSTVIEQILADDPALAGYDGTALGALSAHYAALDRAHVDSLSGPVLTSVVGHIGAALRQHRDQAEALFADLVEERLTTLRDTVTRHPDVARRLRPVIAASPMLVPQVLPPTRTVDLVVLDSAAHLPVEVALAAIARGRQVVVLGDARCASSTAVRALADVLPSVALLAGASRRDPYLTAFLAAHGYAGVLRPTPLPEHRPLVHLDVVDGTGMPDRATGIIDSTREEVEHVVELVLTHALLRPDESLAVITATAGHAEAVREAVLGEVRANLALAAFFDAGRAEPFVVTDLPNVAGLRREAIIFSVGLGRTPHRRVLHSFGPISAPGGDALLLDGLGSTRHRLTVVSCFGADDLDPARLRGAGPQLLADLLSFAGRRSAGSADADLVTPRFVSTESTVALAVAPGSVADSVVVESPEPDRLLLDIAERLWKHGLLVEANHGIPGGERIPLVVGHPDLPDEMLVAVLTDDAEYTAEPSVRVRDRLTADRLERVGWSVVRVWSAAAFIDPQAEVDRIRRAVHARVPAPASPRSGPLHLGLPGVLDESDEADDLPTAAPSATTPANTDDAPAAPASVTTPADADDAPVAGTAPTDEMGTATPAPDLAPVDATPPVDGDTAAEAPSAAEAAPSSAADESAVVTASDSAQPDGAVTSASGQLPVHPDGSVSTDSGAFASHPDDVDRPDSGPVRSVPAHPVLVDSVLTGSLSAAAVRAAAARPPEVSAPVSRAAHNAPRTGVVEAPGASEARAERPTSASAPDGTDEQPAVRPFQLALAVPTRERPDVRKGLPIGAYSDDQLDELVAWLRSDEQERTREQLAAALRDELGVTRRSYRIDTAVRSAIARALS